jgi:hypothetical protein
MEPRDVFVLTPPNTADSSLAIAASRAGGVGVLDLELPPAAASLTSELQRFAQFTSGARTASAICSSPVSRSSAKRLR